MHRIVKLKKLLTKKNLDAVLLSSVPLITYYTGYSGFSTEEREAYLLIVAQPLGLRKPGVSGYILTDARYTEAVKNIPGFTFIEVGKKPLKELFTDIVKKDNTQQVGFEANNITVSEYTSFKKCFTKLIPFPLDTLRIEKDPEEITAITKACSLGDKAFAFLLPKITVGITEKELAFELEFFIKKHGADLSFRTIVAFGKHAATPHHQTSSQKLVANSWVLLDFGVKINNYCSDMTRTVFFGKATEKQKHMYQTVLDAQQKAIEFLNNKSSIVNRKLKTIQSSEVDTIARTHIISQGYPSIPHSLGHGIGLEVHEAPRLSPKSKDLLGEMMVFSIEPGIYLPNVGGVRIEDLVVLTKTGPKLLTNAKRSFIQL